jgi:hypothetical protein
MPTYHLRDAVKKLLPHAEAEQERLYKLTLKYPGRDQSEYEDCRHAVSYAYEALGEDDGTAVLLLATLEQAVQALNTAPNFRVPHLDTNSYEIAAACDRAIAKAKAGQP